MDDAVFGIGGALVGLLAQGGSDLITGQVSGWQDYTGALVGGAVGGWSLLYTGPAVAGIAAGATTNATKQFLKNITNEQCGYDLQSFLVDTAVGGTIGRFLPGARIPGATSGRGSAIAVFNQMVTKLQSGQISSVSMSTAVKMFGGRALNTSLSAGAALAASYDAGMRQMSSEPVCGCK